MVQLVSRTLVRLLCILLHCQVPHIIFQDNVVAAAKANDIRLIVTLTNNWSDYGGMDVYVDQIIGQGQPHDYFYTNPEVIVCFIFGSFPYELLHRSVSGCISKLCQGLDRKVYRRTNHLWLGTRYERRLYTFLHLTHSSSQRTPLHGLYRVRNSSLTFNDEWIDPSSSAQHPRPSSGTCTTTTITNWVKTMSAYIKSLDCNHLVGVGDEGWFNWRHTMDGSYKYVFTHM